MSFLLKYKSKTRERRNIEEYDYLTGLANRKGLHEYYKNLKKNAIMHILYIDIDNFKRINNIYGQSMGDEFLTHISVLIRKYTDGCIFRIGGDEFVVILDGTLEEKQVTDTAERLINNFDTIPYRKDILSIVSISIGIVLNQRAAAPLDDILAKCDGAMYQAKYDGKNRYAVYRAFDENVEINRNIELEMENALRSGQFKLYLQPKVNMVTSKLYGAEALSRWEHPVDGLRSPMVYIPIFEKNGFISKLDMYMFEEVCRLKASWAGEKYEHIPISVNMSRLHLYNEHFPDTLKAIADRYGINTNELELEITENVFIKDSEELIRMVDLLRSWGFIVSIDDFGSGFSALNLLKDIPVDAIKIDKEFFSQSSDNIKGKKVIKNIIALCRDLKLDVITEGIETKEQVDFITSCGCQIAQGFYYSRPLPVNKFVEFAGKYIVSILNNYTFRLNGNLKSEDGGMEGKISGEGLVYEKGIFSDSQSMYFPGGPREMNTVHIPYHAIVNDSFTVALWIKPKKITDWTAALYIKFESGFFGVIPRNEDGRSDMRVRDSREVDGWYDITGDSFRENEWVHYAFSYNSKTETTAVVINGKTVGTMGNVPTNRYVKWIILGGDVFQQSFVGNICELVIYNEPKECDFMKELYDSYVNNEKFIGF